MQCRTCSLSPEVRAFPLHVTELLTFMKTNHNKLKNLNDRPEPIKRTVAVAGTAEKEESQPITGAPRRPEFRAPIRARKPSRTPGHTGQRNAHGPARRVVSRGTGAWRYVRSGARQARRVQFHLCPRHESETNPG